MQKSKYWQIALLLNLFFLLSCFAPTQISAQTTVGKKLTSREIAQQTLPSTVLIVMGNSGTKKIKSGSGFFVAEDVVATNFHVIKDTTEGYVKIYGQEKIYKILGTVGIDEKNDLALLKISSIKGKPLKLNTDDSIAIGDEVFAVGNPEGLEGTFSQGIVSSIRKTDKFNLLQITASISEGSSGGAVLNDKGEVVGVAVGAIESGQSLNFAIPVSFLRTLVLNKKSLATLSQNTGVAETQSSSKKPQKQTKVVSNKPQTVSNIRFKYVNSNRQFSGKVKSVAGFAYTLEAKFDKWELGKLLWSGIEQYNTEGYEMMSEYTTNKSNDYIIQSYKINVDLTKEVLPYSAKRISYFDYNTGRVVKEFYSKCGNCVAHNLQTKNVIYYENGQTTTYDSNGKILEKFIEQIQNAKIIQSYYDGDGKLTKKRITEPNGDKIYETFNQNGKVDYRDITFKNGLGEEINESWYARQNGSLELIYKSVAKTTETENESITFKTYFNSEGKEDGSSIWVYDKKLKLSVRGSYKNSNYKYEYEFDSVGNWIKRTELKEVTKFGKTYFEPQEVNIRKFIYY